MKRWIRRLLLLPVIGGAAAFVKKKRSASSSTTATDESWPPFRPTSTSTTTTTGGGATSAPPVSSATRAQPAVDTSEVPGDRAAGLGWALPVDGQCPDGYPVKANDSSKIYHLPGGRSYDRTIPERCYSSAEAAEADGYRRSKV